MNDTTPVPINVPEINSWQDMVHEFHIVCERPVGNYAKPKDLSGELLELRIGMLLEEHQETMDAHTICALVSTVDGLCDLAYIVLGGFCAAGKVCRNRFALLLNTTRFRGWTGFTSTLNREVRLLSEMTRGAAAFMQQCLDQRVPFKRWDLLDAVMVQLAHTCSATGLDIRPLFAEVHANNLTKKGGPVVNGKLMKPPGYKPVDLRPLLRAQGVGEEWLS